MPTTPEHERARLIDSIVGGDWHDALAVACGIVDRDRCDGDGRTVTLGGAEWEIDRLVRQGELTAAQERSALDLWPALVVAVRDYTLWARADDDVLVCDALPAVA